MTIILVLPNKCILSKVSKMTTMKNSTTLTKAKNEGQDPKLMSKRPTNGKISLSQFSLSQLKAKNNLNTILQ